MWWNFRYQVCHFSLNLFFVCRDGCHLTCHLSVRGWHHGGLNLLQPLPALHVWLQPCAPHLAQYLNLRFIALSLSIFALYHPRFILFFNIFTIKYNIKTVVQFCWSSYKAYDAYFSHIILWPFNIFSTCCWQNTYGTLIVAMQWILYIYIDLNLPS